MNGSDMKTLDVDKIHGFDVLSMRVARHPAPGLLGAQIMWAVMVLLGIDRVPLTMDSAALREVLAILKPELAARVVRSLHRVLDTLDQGKIPRIEQIQTSVKPEMIRRAQRFIPGGDRKKALNAAAMGYGISKEKIDPNDPLAHLDHEPRLEGE